MITLVSLLKRTVETGASDLHILPGEPPVLRVNGELKKINMPALSEVEIRRLLMNLLSDSHSLTLKERLSTDFSYDTDFGRFRVNFFYSRDGLCGVFRYIPKKILSVEELGLPAAVSELTRRKQGLIIVTGPTGSGKSTSLAAMIDHINSTRAEHIITIENPIEFIHRNKRSIITQRGVAEHTTTFSQALIDALREDPDIILIGELRDLDTIALAITAAETGHLVFGTLHTMSASKTLNRIIDVFPAGQQSQIRTQLSETLVAVISQKLVMNIDYNGRVPLNEILVNTPAVSSLLREGKTYQIPTIMQTGLKYGMQTFDQALDKAKGLELVAEDLIMEEL